MRKKIILILFIAFLIFSTEVFAAVPHLVRYQGYLTDSGGTALNGSYNLTLRIYNAAVAGTLLWSETQTGIQVSGGNFTVLLGQVNPLNLAFDSDCWISIEVNSDGEMVPRQRITSVPTAYRAERAENVGGIVASQTPQANTLLPLDANAKIPNLVLYTGSGNGLDADTVDGIQGNEIVKTSGDQAIAGVKTFSSIPTLPASDPTTDNQTVRKAYADTKPVINTLTEKTTLVDNDLFLIEDSEASNTKKKVKKSNVSSARNQLYISGSGNFTAPTGVTKIFVRMCAGGGGGGGSQDGTQTACAGGGAGECMSFGYDVVPASTYAYSVGAGGAGGVAGGNPGADGEDTTFGTGIVLTANKGTGGAIGTGAAGVGGAGNTTLNASGNTGGILYSIGGGNGATRAGINQGGGGGASQFGAGGSGGWGSKVGDPGTGFGSGGGGAGSGSPLAGGPGKGGFVLIEW